MVLNWCLQNFNAADGNTLPPDNSFAAALAFFPNLQALKFVIIGRSTRVLLAQSSIPGHVRRLACRENTFDVALWTNLTHLVLDHCDLVHQPWGPHSSHRFPVNLTHLSVTFTRSDTTEGLRDLIRYFPKRLSICVITLTDVHSAWSGVANGEAHNKILVCVRTTLLGAIQSEWVLPVERMTSRRSKWMMSEVLWREAEGLLQKRNNSLRLN